MARPKKKASKRQFGTTEELPSGRCRARYTHLGRRWKSPRTFDNAERARVWLGKEQLLIDLGAWTPPGEREKRDAAVSVTTDQAVETWVETVGHLAESSRTRYDALRRNYITPYLTDAPVSDLTTADMRDWVNTMERAHGGKTTATAGAYALVHTVLQDMVDTGRLPMNPCTVKGAGTPPKSAPKVVPSAAQLAALVDRAPKVYDVAIQLAAWCALRPAEWVELRRRDIERHPQPPVKGMEQPDRVVLHIDRQAHRRGGKWVVGLPKGNKVRRVEVPPHIVPLLDRQLRDRAQSGPDGLVFLNTRGSQVDPANFGKRFVKWSEGICTGATPHSLRHFGAVTHQQAGATLRETMALLGHTTPAVALQYQSVAHGRMSLLAERMSALAVPGAPGEAEDQDNDDDGGKGR